MQKRLNQEKVGNAFNTMPMEGEDEFKKMFGKDIDEFLDDSNWDLHSLNDDEEPSMGSPELE